MESKITDQIFLVSEHFNEKFADFIVDFSDEIKTELSSFDSIHHDVNDKSIRSKNYSFSIFIFNKKKHRKVHFSFYDGYDGRKILVCNFRFNIENTDERCIGRNKFSIVDYLKQTDNSSKIVDHFEQESFENILKKTDEYLDFVLAFLELNEIKDILFNGKWVDVKPDMSPYK